MEQSESSDVVIAGAGIIGLSLALEMLSRGFSVTVVERGRAMRGASWAAGGMLAAHDPENPPALLPLSLHSLQLYPGYLKKIELLSRRKVPLRTDRTLQQGHSLFDGSATRSHTPAFLHEAQLDIPGLVSLPRNFFWLLEQSLDPRDLCAALPLACAAAGARLIEETEVLHVESSSAGVAVRVQRGRLHAKTFVNCSGAWAGESSLGALPVEPIKGQMVTVALPVERMRCVLRTPDFYAIPRGDGRVTVGATVERAGFDTNVEEPRISALIETAARLLPELAAAPRIESWAGLRPGTPDGLPILGAAAEKHCWHATGHYRNGVLLAPATARVMAQLITGEQPDVPVDNFSPDRLSVGLAASSGLARSK